MARTRLKLSSFNLLNLNEPGLPIYRDSDGFSEDEYKKKIDWSSGVIRSLQSDVWAFQELWHQRSLEEVFRSSGCSDNYTLLIPPEHAGDVIACAAAVKSSILVGEPEWIESFPKQLKLKSGGDDAQTGNISVEVNSFSRPLLHFKIKPRSSGTVIHVYVCHFKSKSPSKIYEESWYSKAVHSKHSEAIGSAISTIRRTAEATALRVILTEVELLSNVVYGDHAVAC